jgi:hypothetical protein
VPSQKSAKPAKAASTLARVSGQRKPVGYALLVAAVGAMVFLFLRQTPSVNLARRVPDNVSFYLEVPSVQHVMSDLKAVKIDDAATTTKQAADGAAGAIAAAFHLAHEDGEAFTRGVVGVALAGRARGSDVATAWLVGLRGAAAVEPFLSQSRLSADGPLGTSGTKYRVAPTGGALQTSDLPALERWARGLSTKDDGVIVGWFPDARLLCIGDATLLSDIAIVVDSGRGSLDGSERWKHVQDALGKSAASADGVFFADERALQGYGPFAEHKVALEGLARDGGVVSGAFDIGPAGLVVRGSVPMSGDGAWQGRGIASAAKLSFPGRLPAETALYVAMSTHRDLDATEAKDRFRRSFVSATDVTGYDIARALDDFQKTIGVDYDDLFKMAGEEVALAVVLGKEFKYNAAAPILKEGLAAGAVVFAIKVDNDVSALRTLNRLQEAVTVSELGRLADVSPDGPGFVAHPKSGAATRVMGILGGGSLPSLRVRYTKKEIIAVLAQTPLADSIYATFDGGPGALAQDPAHVLAMSALRPDAHAYAWVDLGRLASLVYAANPGARVDAKARGWPVDALTLTGPSRATEAVDLHFRATPEAFTVDVEALNPWGPSILSGWLLSVPGARPVGLPLPSRPQPVASAAPTASTPVPLGLGDPVESMPTCKHVLKRLRDCEAFATETSAKEEFARLRGEMEAKFAHTPGDRWQFQNVACAGSFFKLAKDPNCPKVGPILPADEKP